MRNLLNLAILLVTLDGCTGLAKLTMSPRSTQAISYDCTPADNAGVRHLTVAVAPDRNGRELDLKLDAGQPFVLSPLAGATARLYTSPLYAWRAGSNVSVLTDVENIQTYNCRQIGGGKAIALSGGGRALP